MCERKLGRSWGWKFVKGEETARLHSNGLFQCDPRSARTRQDIHQQPSQTYLGYLNLAYLRPPIFYITTPKQVPIQGEKK